MKFYSQQDLISHWEGGRSYRQDAEGGAVTVVSDQARTIPWVTQKYFEAKALMDGGMSRLQVQRKMGAVNAEGDAVADARMKVVFAGNRTEERQGVFLHAFIDDCFSLWDGPLRT